MSRPFRPIAASFVVSGPSGVAIRDRLKHLTPEDEQVLRLVGEHPGTEYAQHRSGRASATHVH